MTKTTAGARKKRRKAVWGIAALGLLPLAILVYYVFLPHPENSAPVAQLAVKAATELVEKKYQPTEVWLQRAYATDELFHKVYTPCWEGAYGAIGDAYLFAATHDSSLLRFHLEDHKLQGMCAGRWVDDRAWICLAELYWWNFTGRTNASLVGNARQRYLEAKNEGRLSHHEGFWSWYNWTPGTMANDRIFTNSNMNQMANVACWLYDATGEQVFLNDALMVWNGNDTAPGIEAMLYKGKGRWEGARGLAAFGKQLPWEGAEYCSIGASLFRVTKDRKYKNIVVATAKWILDPKHGWVDSADFYQIHMDGNGAFVNYLLDAYSIAPKELPDVLSRVEKMLEHVWTNHHGTSHVQLHRVSDHGIRNGWNPLGGEDGYRVDEVGTVHAQAEAVRAFGTFAYYKYGKAR